MKWERFFFYLNRFNAVVLFFVLLAFAVMLGTELWRAAEFDDYGHYGSGPSSAGFGSALDRSNPIVGQAVDTSGGEVVAYFEESEQSSNDGDRVDGGGLTLVDPASGKQLALATGVNERLVDFAYLYDQDRETGKVIGYIAKVSDTDRFAEGKYDLIVGALPAMTKTLVARDVIFSDLPKVRTDGSLGVILWYTQNSAELVGFRLSDGKVVSRANVALPVLEEDRMSQGPGILEDDYLARRPSAFAPRNAFPN